MTRVGNLVLYPRTYLFAKLILATNFDNWPNLPYKMKDLHGQFFQNSPKVSHMKDKRFRVPDHTIYLPQTCDFIVKI